MRFMALVDLLSLHLVRESKSDMCEGRYLVIDISDDLTLPPFILSKYCSEETTNIIVKSTWNQIGKHNNL